MSGVSTSLNFATFTSTSKRIFQVRKPEKEIPVTQKSYQVHEVFIKDARENEEGYDLMKDGFTWFKKSSKPIQKGQSDEDYAKSNKEFAEDVVKKLCIILSSRTGSTLAYAFKHRIRGQKSMYSPDDGFPIADTIKLVHTDFSPEGAIMKIKALIEKDIKSSSKDLEAIKKIIKNNPGCHLAIINVWRALKPIKRDPLAVGIQSSFNHEENAFVSPITDKIPLALLWQHNPNQEWVYLSHQMPEEVLVFFQYDSYSEKGNGIVHTSFDDPRYIKDNRRESVEVSVLTILPEGSEKYGSSK
ncbi:hypothetical protein CROQUDRAFT_704789 [Cronartium quercuum f. sp. fusiforme G11]|uniref:Uncharacterized protein n=1 Tax=Cronartium quercuum f. sp. fusiforme G11 TaxID=708437 RepID=A0A9P6NFC2_9BASI|nr:hypothetical protein CROQUDRAFT_704789 [Cronartium quercuum f. sp. fusiforme G11]